MSVSKEVDPANDDVVQSDLEPEVDREQKKTRRWGIYITMLVFVAFFVAVNLPYRYSEISVVGDVQFFLDMRREAVDPMPVMAGWPFRFLIDYPAESGVPETRLFSASALIRNLAIAVLVGAGLMFYAFLRARRGAMKTGNRRQISIGFLMLATAMIAVPIGYWQWLGTRSEQIAATRRAFTQADSSAIASAWVPEWIAGWMPDFVARRYRKIRAVRMENPGEPSVQAAVQIPTLVSLRIGGGEYDLRLLDALGGMIHLNDLRISGRELDQRVVQMIGTRERLRTLNLMRTNVDARSIASLAGLPQLHSLQLQGTNVALAELGTPSWASTLRELYLPTPMPGTSDSLEIDGWPKLERLSIASTENPLNAEPVSIALTNNPELRDVELDLFQRFDVSLSDLPELKTLSSVSQYWKARVPRGGRVPTSLWVDRFVASGTPKLSQLNLFARGMSSFRLDGPHNVSVAKFRADFQTADAGGFAQPTFEPVSSEAAAAITEGIGRVNGPRRIDLTSVPLEGIDLSPLANNKGIEELVLAKTKTGVAQWQSMKGLDALKSLNLTGMPLSHSDITTVLATFPNLVSLDYGIDPKQLNQFPRGRLIGATLKSPDRSDMMRTVFRGHDKLVDIRRLGTAATFEPTIELIDMPKLQLPVVTEWPTSIRIKNSPMLEGLTIRGPFPEDWAIDELSNLQSFVVGGQHVTDDLIRTITKSQPLNRLTLAYPRVSAEAMKELPVANLEHLHIPGSALNDEVVESWPEMPKLKTIDIADTQVSSKSMKKLLASDQLISVNVNRCNIDPGDLLRLANKDQLKELHVAGVGIHPSLLQSIVSTWGVNSIDLSETELSDQTLDIIIDAPNKGSAGYDIDFHFALRNASVNSEKLLELIRSKTEIIFDLTGTPVDSRIDVALIEAGAMEDFHQWRFIRRQQRYPQEPLRDRITYAAMQMRYVPYAHLATEQFAPGGPLSPEGLAQSGARPVQGGMTIGGRNVRGTATFRPSTPNQNAEQPASEGSWFGNVMSNLFGGKPTEGGDTENEPETVNPATEESSQ